MIRRVLQIGRWTVEFYFAEDGYDEAALLDRMYEFGAGPGELRRAESLMDHPMNTGFTFSNPVERVAIVAIGPTSSGEEFQDTLVHEVHHVAVEIASGLGIDLRSEAPAYMAGDTVRDLAQVICRLGCDSCRK